MTYIHIDLADKHEGLPEYGEAKKCDKENCPGPEEKDKENIPDGKHSWDTSYGLAGGGMGVYTFCSKCEQVIDKTLDPEEE